MSEDTRRTELEREFSVSVAPLQRQWATATERAVVVGDDLPSALSSTLETLSRVQDPLTQTELARALGIERSSFTRLLDRFCDAGLVERFRIKDDRRVNLLRLTAAGSIVNDSLKDTLNNFRSAALHGVASEDLVTCLQVFSKIHKNLSSTIT